MKYWLCMVRNGLTNEHTRAIKVLKELEEIILFFDGDEAGGKAITEHSKTLNKLLPKATISKVNCPKEEDINSLVQSHDPEILEHLINEREVLFSKLEEKKLLTNDYSTIASLNTENPEYLLYQKSSLQIAVLGGINLFALDKLKVTLKITRTDNPSPFYSTRQSNLDLYHADQTEKFIQKVARTIRTRYKRNTNSHSRTHQWARRLPFKDIRRTTT